MKTAHGQKGMSFLCSLFMLFTLILCSIFLFRLGPVYWEHFVVNSHFNKLSDTLTFSKGDNIYAVRRAIIQKFEKRLLVENIRNFDLEKLTVSRVSSGFKANLQYIMDTDFIGNVDFIVIFHDEVLFEAK